jgi:Predicted metal-dependent hydrolase
MPIWPTAQLPNIVPIGIASRDGYNVELYTSTTHTGTHVDAPYHFVENGKTVDRIELNTLVSEGYCLKLKPKSTEITKEEISSKWKNEYDGKTILINTGWSKKRSFTKEFLYEFPGLSMEAASFLLEKKVKVIGIDTLGIEPYSHLDFPVHKLLFKNDVVVIEDLNNLEELAEGKKYLIVALPLRIKGASGSMARVIALDVF